MKLFSSTFLWYIRCLRVFFYFQCVVQFAARFLGMAGGGLIAQTAHHLFFGQAESIRFLGGLVQREIRNSSQSPSSKLPQLPLFVGPPLLKNRMTKVWLCVPDSFCAHVSHVSIFESQVHRELCNLFREFCRSQILHWLAGYVYGSVWGTLEMVVRSPEPSICW